MYWGAKMNLKVIFKDYLGWCVEFPIEFESLTPQQKLDMLQDSIYDLNNKWKEVDEKY